MPSRPNTLVQLLQYLVGGRQYYPYWHTTTVLFYSQDRSCFADTLGTVHS